jgi:hypothetical protein
MKVKTAIKLQEVYSNCNVSYLAIEIKNRLSPEAQSDTTTIAWLDHLIDNELWDVFVRQVAGDFIQCV